ncbi:hypothetical protein A6A04_01485 [Paramagnetospirillum marisnigri]|uniref:Lipoprotein n=2 Tax=Paramagnetospirillum marisnigri TaxID=1285242 RepID=A0A178MU91_9PROT|nr:hypothetical protein A6A04_01485 [Paramagnetospirillum marisnigri]
MKPADFAAAQPKLVLEEYFAGRTQAWGLFQDRFGTVKRQFTVEITGTWDGEQLVLDEQFLYNDGETDQRVWTIRKRADGGYEGRAADVVGVASGLSAGNALNWAYVMDLKVGDGTLRVAFDDWMFLQPGGAMINRARVSKWGIDVGEVTLFFMKPGLKAAS